jgi:hypothetical protein
VTPVLLRLQKFEQWHWKEGKGTEINIPTQGFKTRKKCKPLYGQL